MSVTASVIKDLREASGAGMMDCKKALNEVGGDFEQAKDWLRKNGLAAAAKKSARVASEGVVAIHNSGKEAAIIELNAETDFVAKNEQFQALAAQIASVSNGNDVEVLKNASLDGKEVQNHITDAVATIGENINLRRCESLAVSKGIVASYIHNAYADNIGKIGVLVALKSDGDAEKLQAIGKQIAMHIAAAKPESLNIEGVNQANLEREKDIFREQAQNSGKPAEIIEKMVEGRIRKYYEQVVLPEQLFVIDGKSKVKEVLEAAGKEIGADIVISGYSTFVLGEGIEKKEEDFAEEVAKVAAQ